MKKYFIGIDASKKKMNLCPRFHRSSPWRWNFEHNYCNQEVLQITLEIDYCRSDSCMCRIYGKIHICNILTKSA